MVVWKQDFSHKVGKTSGFSPVSVVNALQFPVDEKEVGGVVVQSEPFAVLLYVGGWYNQMWIDALDQPIMYLGMIETQNSL